MQDPAIRAKDAIQLLENAVLKDAFKDIETSLINILKSVAITNHEMQHEVTLMLQLLGRLETQIKSYAETGSIIEFNELRKRNIV